MAEFAMCWNQIGEHEFVPIHPKVNTCIYF